MPSANKKKTLGRQDVRTLKSTQKAQVVAVEFLGQMKNKDVKIASYLVKCVGYDSVVAIRRVGPFKAIIVQTVISKDGKRIIADTIGRGTKYDHAIDTAVKADIERMREKQAKKDAELREYIRYGIYGGLGTSLALLALAYAGAGVWVAELLSK